MITLRPSQERGHARFDWLDTRYTFSFADYYDLNHMGFSDLRVINQDVIAPGGGFGEHPHHDMEILTWVLEGALRHGDSMGNGGVIEAGEAQIMCAGPGIVHSERNASEDHSVHLLQIWIKPPAKRLPSSYGQRAFSHTERRNRLCRIAGPARDGITDEALPLHQDAHVFACDLDGGKTVAHALGGERRAWVQVTHGELTVNSTRLSEGDGAAIEQEAALVFSAAAQASFLVFDLR